MLQLLKKMAKFRLALHREGEMQAIDIYPQQIKEDLPVVTITLLITRFSNSQQS